MGQYVSTILSNTSTIFKQTQTHTPDDAFYILNKYHCNTYTPTTTHAMTVMFCRNSVPIGNDVFYMVCILYFVSNV